MTFSTFLQSLSFIGCDKTIWSEIVVHSYRTVGLMLIICRERSWGVRRDWIGGGQSKKGTRATSAKLNWKGKDIMTAQYVEGGTENLSHKSAAFHDNELRGKWRKWRVKTFHLTPQLICPHMEIAASSVIQSHHSSRPLPPTLFPFCLSLYLPSLSFLIHPSIHPSEGPPSLHLWSPSLWCDKMQILLHLQASV